MTENFELVSYNDDILKKQCEYFDFTNPPFEPIEFSKNLIKFMYEKNGIGLAANQIGIPYRIFAMRGEPENFVCFNPRIVDKSTEEIILDEGCLTWPNLYVKVKRPRHIKVRFNTPNGDILTKKFTGMSARIFQHELEHLDGKRFFENLSKLKLEMSIKKANKQDQKYTLLDFK